MNYLCNEHIREPYFFGLKEKLQQSNFVITRRIAAAAQCDTHTYICIHMHTPSPTSCVCMHKTFQLVGQVWKIFKRKVRLEKRKINTLRARGTGAGAEESAGLAGVIVEQIILK